ncbi:hypothetical protein [Nocardiopsis dassonvillei]|uniref:Lipoprotein n=1 Tax=Nocardiopsis dassonvillei (strain ATCC 23218 / DSM 43111 / CIP 107115 / JCM 7437 / KCTC 9190 / NBRC 14626 / NCTC 10488 / NRRL B-5397 / IMRU 509) TaxID=446468 RepID=D7B3D6_NOCDD|nr:hypothetical protein [Nocardiopsis dassonvillei]ADH66864.1 conserved hypothetical protein [Nocardiopsis dassonvillei subsp. dassonvillei DSM 43111]NKY80883.1 hypothetical protein [Nocardiopsis dassonvillei]VEI86572.1 Uncharacterised protein [Nocardiopsis dassonvillei]
MNLPHPRLAAFLLPLAALTACSSPDQQEQDASPSAETPAAASPSAPASPSPSPSASAGPPTLADLPEEGRDLASCEDGQCRVTVQPGDRIPVPEEAGGTEIVIGSISGGEVTFQQNRSDGGSTTVTLKEAGQGSGMLADGNRFTLAFPEIGDGEAVMQVDV